MYFKRLRSITLAITGAAILAQGALAAGEPKNEWPFTRPVDQRTTQAISTTLASASARGEAKNQLPFTRPVPTQATVIVQSGGGFSWTDGAIGAVAGIGIALSAGAALALARKAPRTA